MEPQAIKQLQLGCDELGLTLDAQQSQHLVDYLALLAKWNRAYNLTAIRDESQMVTRHLLDCLAISGHITGKRLVDAGSGAGLPGVPLAIVFPHREFLLIDSNGKKTRFLFQVKTALRLDNIEVCQTRVESLRVARPFDAVLSRAFASLQDMIRDCRHLLAPEGRLLAMKGAYPTQELESVCQTGTSVVVHSITVPGLDEQRHLVEMALPPSPESPEKPSGSDH